MTVYIDAVGELQIRIGDQYVQLAAAALVDAIRRRPEAIRAILRDGFGEMADASDTATLREVYGALEVICAELAAEEVRALSAAGV
ncbi:hypothetical protein [Micromonospora maritima]|uniref:hypothetical protein n=1 Tax=Micromonospora maritima TaxID=986711 RepID=UPI0037A952C1